MPRRGVTPPFPGVVGLVVPDLAAIRARLMRLDRLGRFAGTAYGAEFGEEVEF